MIVGYARVSTLEQDFDTQIARLKEAGADQVFSEKRSAVDVKGRAQLEAAMQSLRPGDVFMVTKLDRFARNTLDLLKLMERVRNAGAEFRCLDQPISTTGPMGNLMISVLGAFAQFENDIRKERQLEGIAAAKAKGVFDASRHQIAPGKLSHCSRLLKEGLSYVQVSEKMGVSVDTLQRRWPQYKTLTPEARRAAQKRKTLARPELEAMNRGLTERLKAAEAKIVNETAEAMYGKAAPDPADQPWIRELHGRPPKRRGLFGVFGR